MSGGKEESLSPDEMRKRLYQTFKKRGVLDTLKTQLRNQLIQELKHPFLTGESLPKSVPVKTSSVLEIASNSLVIEHLQSSGYEYTLSVFYPESGMNTEKCFSTRDILQLMKISPRSSLYKSLTSSIQRESQKGFLMNLLTELIDHHIHRDCSDANTQTSNSEAFKESLVEKMQMIDEEYEVLRSRGNKWHTFEARLAEYRKEIEEQAQAEINTKLQHLKDVEIAKVKMEEKEKAQKEILDFRRDMERTYEMKSEALIHREKNAIERLQKQQQIEEKEIYMQRQALLKEIETVRNREAELRQRAEAFEKTCKLQEEKTKVTEDLLKRRELAVKTMEDTYDQKLKNELARYQVELKADYVRRTEQLSGNEKRNKEETVRIQKEASAIDAKLQEHSQALAEVKRLKMELETAQSQSSLVGQQNELLRERLESMSDYPVLRRERVELQAQVRLLTQQVEEAQEDNRHLRQALSQPSAEQLALCTELRRLEAAKRLQEEEHDSQRQVLHAQLQQEVERVAQLKSQLLECEERSQWMATHAEDIKMQLRQAQLALENEVLRNPKPSLVDRTVLELNADRLLPPDMYVDRDVLRAQAGGGVRGGGWRDRSVSPDSDLELVAGAKARIRELEKEAETLEEAYRSYQQRALHAAVSHALPQRAQSPTRHKPTALHHHYHQHAKALSLAHQRVTFASDLPAPRVDVRPPVRESDLQPVSYGRAPLAGEVTPPQQSLSPAPRRLSSTPVSIAKHQPRRELLEEALPVPLAGSTSPARQLSPIPAAVRRSGDFSPMLSDPSSPQLKSTSHQHSSPPNVAQEVSSSESSSPQPAEIAIDDLTEPSPEPSHIPELLQEEGIRVSEEAPEGHDASPPVPTQPSAAQANVEAARQEEEEEEELRWEMERKRREERRQREQRQAQERELRELERLEQERLLQEAQYESQEAEVERGGAEKRGQGQEVEGLSQEEQREQVEASQQLEPERGPASDPADPLQTYMRMVMQGGESERQQSPKKEEAERRSPELDILSDKDNSVTAFSHEEADEDFW
ncbi:oral-facial-digital syndrome 1 protein homolog isoform X1 [Alosa sapidissima]|uniref:oral-facial-digital syndrome 1 protein homolog isoform X1 n=1 Tax=Alosa sapidissima TaxID=34773 RepID=UPI001C08B2C7|nr:oral-facial-digital syndrome 1 protein homolog isoform X1 [Alosa sapidissima]